MFSSNSLSHNSARKDNIENATAGDTSDDEGTPTAENNDMEQQDMSQQQQGESPQGDESENVESQQKDGFEESSESPVGHIFPNSGGNSDPQPDELASSIANEENNGEVSGSSRSKVEKAQNKVVKSHLAKLHQTKADKKQEISARCLTCANSCPTDCYDSHHFGGAGGIGGYGGVGGYGSVGHGDFGGYGGYSGGGYGGHGALGAVDMGYGGGYLGGHGVAIGGAGFNGYGHGGSYGHHGYVGNLGGFADYGHHADHHEAVVHRPDLVVPQPPDIVHRPDIVIHRKPIIIHRRPVIYHQNPVVVHKPPVVVHQSPIYVHPVVHHHRIITHHVHDYHIEPQVHHSGCECTGKRDCLCDPNSSSSNSAEEKRARIEGKLSKTDSHKKQEIASRCLDCGNNCDADCPSISPVGGYLGGVGHPGDACVDQVPLTHCETRKDEQMFKRPDIVVPQPPDIIHRPDIVIHRAPIVIHRRPVVYHQSPIVVHKPPVVVHQAPIIVHPVVHHHRVVTHHVHDYHIMPHHQDTGCSCAGKKDCVCGDPNKEIQLPDSETAPTEDVPTEEVPAEGGAGASADKAAEVNVRSGIPKPEIVKKTTIDKEEDYSQTKKKKKDVVVSRPPIIYHPPPEIYHRPDIVVHRPPLLIHRPSIIYHQPPVIVHRPAVVYHQPPLIFHQPPPAVQQPLLVSHDSFRVRPSATYTHMGSVVNKVGSYVGVPHGPISNYPESRFYNERGYGPAPDHGYRGFGNEHLSYAGPGIEGHGFGEHAPLLEGFGGHGAIEGLVHAPENFAAQDFGHHGFEGLNHGGFAGEHVPLGFNGHPAENFGHSLPVEELRHESFGTHGSFEGFGAHRVEAFGHYGLGHRPFDEFGGRVAQSGFAHVTPESSYPTTHGSGFGGFGHGAAGVMNNFARTPFRESMASRREMLPEGFEPAGQNPAGGLGFPPEGTS